MKFLRYFSAILIVAVLVATTLSVSVHTARAASLVQITNFGTNPTGLGMYLYVPASAGANPAILVAVHYCTGSAQAFFSGTEFASLADQYGFIIIYPSATRSGNCFDNSSPQALIRNGGSDPVGIMSMVTYVEQHNNGDPNRVYVTGASSGGMMTNVLLGDYPDVFKAGAAFMGVPDTCFAASAGDPTNPANQAGWNSTCSAGQSIKTAQQWGDAARGADPGYNGPRPRVQLWHGTADTTLAYPNFGEEIKQWTNVLGVSQTPSFTDTPQSGWTRTRYGGTGVNAPVEGISISNVGHSLPLAGQALMAIQFFGLNGAPPATPTRTNTPTTGPSLTPTRTFTPTNTSVPGTVSINTGGSATGSFTADQFFSGGTAFTNTATIDMSQITSNPPPAAIFNSERYGAMTYTIPNLSGAQTVTLYFAETFLTAAGQRLFNVTINGTTVLSSFDIYASAGGQNKAIARTFNTTANGSGQVVIQFTTGTENPKVNGITVAAGTGGPTNTPTPTPTRTPTPQAGVNFLTNADMESGTTNWVVNGAGTLSSDTSQFHGGTHSVKITGRTASWNGPGQNVAVSNFPTSGQNVTVSVWVRSQTGTPTSIATLRLTASTTTYVQLASAAINSTGWTQLTATVPVSWSGTLTGVLFYVETAAGTDNIYIDDASLHH
jgi:poly(hydroxyalkanoate) depolymerase family esterase